MGNGGNVSHVLNGLGLRRFRHGAVTSPIGPRRPVTDRSAIAVIASAARSSGSTRSMFGLSLPSPAHCMIACMAHPTSFGQRFVQAPLNIPMIE